MTIESQVTEPLSSRDILSVTQLNQAVSRLLEQSFSATWVRGEISNFTQASSGHWYFTLKDQVASVRAVMFRSRAAATGFIPRTGDAVELRGRVMLYEARGEYQLQVEQMRRGGLGSLFEAFVALKSKLASEGMFESEAKRQITAFPKAIGVMTSLGAAALRDVLTALARRAPHVPVIIYPSPVQGMEAAVQLRQALAHANERLEVDTILMVRGGGSIEDLWSFNDEALARDIAASVIPVISGVGHETDFTIADFVADLRAPTPTAAAELSCVARDILFDRLEHAHDALTNRVQRQIDRLSQRVDRAAAALVSPAQRLAHQQEKLQSLTHRLSSAWQRFAQLRASRQDRVVVRLSARLPDLAPARTILARLGLDMVQAQRRQIALRVASLEHAHAQLRTLSPEHTLGRGYAIVQATDGSILRDATLIESGQSLNVTLAKGTVHVRAD